MKGKRIRELAAKHKRYGVRRITVLLKREAWRVNKKRVRRIWKEEGLQRRRKGKKKRAAEVLGISRPRLDRLIAKHDLEVPTG